MFSYNDTREKTLDDAYSYTSSSFSSANNSATAIGGGFTEQSVSSAGHSMMAYSAGVSISSQSWTSSFMEQNELGSSTMGVTYRDGGTFSNSAYVFTSSSTYHAAADTPTGVSTDGGSASTGIAGTFAAPATTFWTSSTSQQTSFYGITSTASFTTSGIVTTTGLGGVPSWTTAQTTVTQKSTADSGHDGFTSSSTYSEFIRVSSANSGAMPIELGTVIVANDPQEWIWAASFAPDVGMTTATDGTFLADFATSFTRQTFWQTKTAIPVDFAMASAGQSGDTYSLFTPSTKTITYVDTAYTGERTITHTSGDEFSRKTYTTTVDSMKTSSESSSYGTDAETFTAFGTYSTASPGSYRVATSFKGLLNVDGSNWTTVALSTTYARFGWISSTIANSDSYLSRQEDGTTDILGDTSFTSSSRLDVGRSYTRATPMAAFFASHPAASGLNHERVAVPRSGGLQNPKARGIFNDVGTNLLAVPPHIYYPFTSSVMRGVVAPLVIPERTSALNSGSGQSWFFDWQTGTLFFTQKNSGQTTFSSGSVAFSTDGAQQTFLSSTHDNRILGGHGDYNQERNTYYREANAFKLFKVDDDGGTTTTKFAEQDFTSSTIASGIVMYEERFPFGVPITLVGAKEPTVIAFIRNFSAAFDM